MLNVFVANRYALYAENSHHFNIAIMLQWLDNNTCNKIYLYCSNMGTSRDWEAIPTNKSHAAQACNKAFGLADSIPNIPTLQAPSPGCGGANSAGISPGCAAYVRALHLTTRAGTFRRRPCPFSVTGRA